MTSKIFKASNGVYFTKQLFLETAPSETRDLVLYTLKDSDHTLDGRSYPSLRRLYLDTADESEYLFAGKYFDGWPHFKKLLNCPWFVDYLSEWREELRVRQMAESFATIKAKAKTGDVATAKYLLERGWDKSDPVGRPSKAAIKRKAEDLVKSSGDISEDFQRISASMSFN